MTWSTSIASQLAPTIGAPLVSDVSHRKLTVDRDGWLRVADELAEALERIDAIREEGPPPAGADERQIVEATAVLMLYESGSCAAAADGDARHDDADVSREEALSRAWDLSDELDMLLVPPGSTDWVAVIDRAEQIRVVASVALARERERREPRPASS
jgi:hypothetical protein